MAFQEQKEVSMKLRKQLALAVTSIQWSYAIFWSISAKQPGVLEWGDGYYNGAIKTRKTGVAEELNGDKVGFQRSDQLRELFESLSLGKTTPECKRPTAPLSPEDLTDAEWYFLVCMSFVFNIGQGLPGRTLAKNETVWLSYAHCADTKFFSRSLLAKTASIQTVVCFPHLGGVIELGTTELIAEDLNLIQPIKTSLLEMPENNLDRLLDCSNDIFDNPPNLVDEASEMRFKDDGICSNGLNNSMNSSDCVSESHGNLETTVVRFSDRNNATNNCQQKHNSYRADDVHYQCVLSSILKNSRDLIPGPCLRKGNRRSSFLSWNDIVPHCCQSAQIATQQSILKKVLFEVTRMHENSQLIPCKQNVKKDDLSRQVVGKGVDRNHILSERKRREKLNERFMILASILPSCDKVDKASILDHMIKYLRELERKVEELQSARRSKPHDDAIERTSDNCSLNKKGNITDKRKAIDMDKTADESRSVRSKDASTDSITVSVANEDVAIEMRCSLREYVLLRVMEAITKLHLDSQTVQSSNCDGILSISIKAKCKGVKCASAGVIRQALQKVARG